MVIVTPTSSWPCDHCVVFIMHFKAYQEPHHSPDTLRTPYNVVVYTLTRFSWPSFRVTGAMSVWETFLVTNSN